MKLSGIQIVCNHDYDETSVYQHCLDKEKLPTPDQSRQAAIEVLERVLPALKKKQAEYGGSKDQTKGSVTRRTQFLVSHAKEQQ